MKSVTVKKLDPKIKITNGRHVEANLRHFVAINTQFVYKLY